MGAYPQFTEHLHDCDFDAAFRKTFLGQAHLAGTGPKGKTCRECRFWHLMDHGRPVAPGHYAKTNKEKAGCLKEAKCNAPMPHKANRRFPHTAIACRLFEQNDQPPPLQRSNA